MKPHRMRMTHNLLVSYGLYSRMDVLPTPRATDRDMTRFHSDEYISFLKTITPYNIAEQATSLCRFNVLEDCPVFDGLFEYCQIAAGGSLAGAARLNSGDSEVAINWAGGLHHAKKAEASGFCYINDCVLAILELLKVHSRVLYCDIDIHHGDGVEEAFYTTDRVMTASFHKFGDYFPGTGDANDIGLGRGKHYSLNFPLRDGIDDESYREIFVPVMEKIMEWYRPDAVVLQCGADSLSGDRLGCFNLSLLGHAQCVDFFKKYNVPMLVLGGGGYTVRNVARCWAYETSRVVGVTLSDSLPYNDNYEFYGPDFRLHITPSNMENHNSPGELQKMKERLLENLRHLPYAPSVQMMDTPRGALGVHRRDEDDEDPDVRQRSRRARYVVDYAGSDDEDDQCLSSLRSAKTRQNRMNFARRRFPKVTKGGGDDRARGPGVTRDVYSPSRDVDAKPEDPGPVRMTAATGAADGVVLDGAEIGEGGNVETGFSDRREMEGRTRARMERGADDGGSEGVDNGPSDDGSGNGRGAERREKDRNENMRNRSNSENGERGDEQAGKRGEGRDHRKGGGKEGRRLNGRGSSNFGRQAVEEEGTESDAFGRLKSCDASNVDEDEGKKAGSANGREAGKWGIGATSGETRKADGSGGDKEVGGEGGEAGVEKRADGEKDRDDRSEASGKALEERRGEGGEGAMDEDGRQGQRREHSDEEGRGRRDGEAESGTRGGGSAYSYGSDQYQEMDPSRR